MKKRAGLILLLFLFPLLLIQDPRAGAARARIETLKDIPYRGAITVAEDGTVLFADSENKPCYPASIVKLMMLLIIQEKLESGTLELDEEVIATAEAAGMGGSQVYLAENEIFSIEDLLYALIIQSANDAAVALAVHVAGSKDGFVEMMNKRARELGMDDTEFHSVHGLPPGKGQKPDISTPQDIAVLGRELFRHPAIFRYTSASLRSFRNGTFEMRSHNPLLEDFPGCDGLKTGYFRAGGFSIAAAAEREGRRVLTVVLGSEKKEERNRSARELLARAFSSLPPAPEGVKGAEKGTDGVPPLPAEAESGEIETALPPAEKVTCDTEETAGGGGSIFLYLIVFLLQAGLFFWLGRRSVRKRKSHLPPSVLQR